MKKQLSEKETQETALLPEYGRKKLLTYADSFMRLAKSFYGMEIGETQEGTDVKTSRETYLWQKRLMENRGLLADHLCEMSRIMTGIAQESYHMKPMGDRTRYHIAKELKKRGIRLHRLFCMTNENGKLEVAATMRARLPEPGEGEYTVADIAGLLSVTLGVRLNPAAGSTSLLTDELSTVVFEEETRYHILTGVARVAKEGERISGDNYTFCEMGQGRFAAVLADGMGSGEQACRASELVVELFEQFLESGFSANGAAQMINGALLSSAQETDVSTLDACCVNRYTGACSLMKAGASGTYIKRDSRIEMLDAAGLPLGVFGQLEMTELRCELMHGEYLIMLSDGVSDCFTRPGAEALFEDMLARLEVREPGEMANAILRQAIYQSEGRIADDMTVLVLGLWENGGC